VAKGTDPGARVCQGDLIRYVDHLESADLVGECCDVASVRYPLVVVLTQDCDLRWDYEVRRGNGATTQDRRLLSVLVAPAYNAEHVFTGDHLIELGIRARPFPTKVNATERRILRQNQNPRYHYLEFADQVDVSPSIVDFKHYFSVDAAYLEERKVAGFATALPLFHREDVSQRFAAFLARIALPVQVEADSA